MIGIHSAAIPRTKKIITNSLKTNWTSLVLYLVVLDKNKQNKQTLKYSHTGFL